MAQFDNLKFYFWFTETKHVINKSFAAVLVGRPPFLWNVSVSSTDRLPATTTQQIYWGV